VKALERLAARWAQKPAQALTLPEPMLA